MHKVDAIGATGSNEFTDGDPGVPTPATVLAEKWHNTIQREIVKVVEDLGGLTLDDSDDTQLFQSLGRLVEASDKTDLTKTSVTAIQLAAASIFNNYITINFERVDISTPLTVTTSDNLLAADGTDSGGGPAASTLYNVYASNPSATFRPSALGLSATAHTNGYLAASGNGANWRHVGAVYLDGSTQIAEDYNICGRGEGLKIFAESNNSINRTSGSTDWYDVSRMSNVVLLETTNLQAMGHCKYMATTTTNNNWIRLNSLTIPGWVDGEAYGAEEANSEDHINCIAGYIAPWILQGDIATQYRYVSGNDTTVSATEYSTIISRYTRG